MTHVTCRLTAKNRDQLRYPTLGNLVWAAFTFYCTQACAPLLRYRPRWRWKYAIWKITDRENRGGAGIKFSDWKWRASPGYSSRVRPPFSAGGCSEFLGAGTAASVRVLCWVLDECNWCDATHRLCADCTDAVSGAAAWSQTGQLLGKNGTNNCRITKLLILTGQCVFHF